MQNQQPNISSNKGKNQSANFQKPRSSDKEIDQNLAAGIENDDEIETAGVEGTDEDVDVDVGGDDVRANPSRFEGNNTQFNQSVTGTGNQNSRNDNRSDSLKAQEQNGQQMNQRAGLGSQGADKNASVKTNDQNQMRH